MTSEHKMPVPGALCHCEIPVSDIEAAKKFYGENFGWQFTDVPEMNYVIYTTGEGGIGGGIMKRPDGAPQQMTNYIAVEDLDAATRKAVDSGGRLLMERTEVPDTGWFTIVSDPDGNLFGLWQSAPGHR